MIIRNSIAQVTAALCTLVILPHGAAQELRTLKVSVVEGDGGINDIRRRTAHDIVIEVRNDQGQPVPDAKVVFTAPANGASILFAGGSRTYITSTDSLGHASVRGLRPSAIEGRFTIQVTASLSGQVGNGLVVQSNTLAGGKPASGGVSGKTILLIVLLGAGAGAGLAIGLRGSEPAPTTLSVGAITVGSPR